MKENILWELVKQNAKHIEIINREMGAVQNAVEWLTWYVRLMFFGIWISLINNIFNTFLLKKNSRNKNFSNNDKHK
jgi:hypothetical protein